MDGFTCDLVCVCARACVYVLLFLLLFCSDFQFVFAPSTLNHHCAEKITNGLSRSSTETSNLYADRTIIRVETV